MASPPSEVLARQVRRWRTERRLSAQDLANRLAELGSTSLNRRVVSKIETGERGVSVDEWLQLAHALAVPPPLLLLDLQSGDEIAVAPLVALHPWLVWGWVTGEHAPPLPSERGGAVVSRVEEFSRARTAIQLYQQERTASDAADRAMRDSRAAEYAGDEAALKASRAAYVAALRDLTEALDGMIENGMTPPGKTREAIETIRSLGLSRYPDKLVVFDGPGGGAAGGEDGI